MVSPVGTSNYVATTATQNYHTAFAQSGITEASGSLTAITKLTLPDGSSYSFTYDSGTGAGNYAQLSSMTLPTGATIQFGFANFFDAFGNVNHWVISRTSGGQTWYYTPSVVTSCTTSNCWQKVDVQKPSGGHAVYNFFLNNGAWVSNVQYTSSNAQNITVQSTYSTCGTCGPTSNIVKQTETTILSPYPYVAGKDITKTVTYTFSDPTNGLVGQIDESDYSAQGSGTAGSLLRRTLFTYATLSGTNMINRPYQVTVQNGSGTKIAQTTYSYDQTGVASSWRAASQFHC